MTPETLLIAGITAVVGALGEVTRRLWLMIKAVEKRCTDCEIDRERLHMQMAEMQNQLGIANGQNAIFLKCPVQGCPFVSRTNGTPVLTS